MMMSLVGAGGANLQGVLLEARPFSSITPNSSPYQIAIMGDKHSAGNTRKDVMIAL